MSGFIKFNRSKEAIELLKDPNSFALLSIIAVRAKRTNDFSIHNLKQGEALIGDFKAIGLSEQNYRTSKNKLESWGFVTTKVTNRGTIATICDKRIWDINEDQGNGPANSLVTDSQRTANGQVTTNKKNKKDKKIKEGNNKDIYVQSFNEFWIKYPKLKGKHSAAKSWSKITEAEQGLAMDAIDKQREGLIGDGLQYCPLASTWLNGKRWEDEAEEDHDDRFDNLK